MNKLENYYISPRDVARHYEQMANLDGYYGSIYEQNGDGLGSLISSVARGVMPFIKGITQKIFLPAAKDAAITGMKELSTDLLAGEKPHLKDIGLASLKAAGNTAKKNIVNELVSTPLSRPRTTSSKRTKTTINRARPAKKRRIAIRKLF